MIELLHSGKQQGWRLLRQAIETALELGCSDVAAVRHLLSSASLQHTPSESFDLGVLQRYERPMPALNEYDGLLTAQEVLQ